MDPVTAYFLAAITNGILGNRADPVFTQLHDWWSPDDPDINSLQRAIRVAYLQATSHLVNAYLDELGQSGNFFSQKALRLGAGSRKCRSRETVIVPAGPTMLFY